MADCCCEVASVDDINAKLRPPLVEILHTAFFRHFHVRLARPLAVERGRRGALTRPLSRPQRQRATGRT